MLGLRAAGRMHTVGQTHDDPFKLFPKNVVATASLRPKNQERALTKEQPPMEYVTVKGAQWNAVIVESPMKWLQTFHKKRGLRQVAPMCEQCLM